MDSKSTNLTKENMTSDPSLTSSVSKQNGTMTVKMDLIPKMEKSKDTHSVKAKAIKERLMEFIQYFGRLFKKAPQNDIEAQVLIDFNY
uniref:Set apart in position or space protein n=1 Tax=Meloidogyne hapla TaxID=6305 RepID=A0A1I8BAZ3_MELHA